MISNSSAAEPEENQTKKIRIASFKSGCWGLNLIIWEKTGRKSKANKEAGACNEEDMG